ncbi:hypothetical protein [Rathayibacter toxicus]|uniref:hypothetical protein n=1 Tax=Rathayibacter toxicus TaxID=145458 RepID=UPI000AC8AD39|nr:hypothetical protein [Rathayibacter toxicus]QOD08899.1 hypothetical protein AYW78_03390 [Rathayibacter toxicus]
MSNGKEVAAIVVHPLEQVLQHDLVGLVRVSVPGVQPLDVHASEQVADVRLLRDPQCGRVDARCLAVLPAQRRPLAGSTHQLVPVELDVRRDTVVRRDLLPQYVVALLELLPLLLRRHCGADEVKVLAVGLVNVCDQHEVIISAQSATARRRETV